MLLKKSFIKFSGIHGIGCFTQEDIKKGERVWELDPDLDITIPANKINSYPPAITEFLKMYAYGQETGSEKIFILCGDHARHMNHSEDPNLIEAGDGNAFNIAARDIKAGEELTCNYNEFDTDASFKLNH